MKLVKQKTPTDCGVACLAMLAGISWTEARNALFPDQRKRDFGIKSTEIMRTKLKEFGIVTSERFVHCKYPERLPMDAILQCNRQPNRDTHWVVWDAHRNKILDPDPTTRRLRVHSFLAVLRRER